MKKDGQKHWVEVKERGNYWGMKTLMLFYRLGGQWLMYPILIGVVLYFFVTRRSTRLCSWRYLGRIYRIKKTRETRPGLRLVWRHYLSFANALFHRISAWMGQITLADIDFPEQQQMLGLMQPERGVIVLGAHVGNLEMCRAIMGSFDLGINVVINSRHTQQFNKLLKSVSKSDKDVNLIATEELTPATAIDIKERLNQGECLVILADRVSQGSSDRCITLPFLGDDILLPEGSFRLVLALDVPVVFMACVKVARGYRVVYENLSEKSQAIAESGKRVHQMRALAKVYVDSLTRLCLSHPLQWFNFYDYWGDNVPKIAAKSTKN